MKVIESDLNEQRVLRGGKYFCLVTDQGFEPVRNGISPESGKSTHKAEFTEEMDTVLVCLEKT